MRLNFVIRGQEGGFLDSNNYLPGLSLVNNIDMKFLSHDK